MKKMMFGMMALGLSMLGLSQNASAFWMNAQATVTAANVSAYVCNSSYDNGLAMRCRVHVTGVLNTGIPLTAWTDLVLPVGACDYAYVYVNLPGLYFINGSARANCSWAY